MRELVAAAGHRVRETAIVPDEPTAVRDRVIAWALDPSCDVDRLLRRHGAVGPRPHRRGRRRGRSRRPIDGFGELFRLLSFEEIGSAAMLSRAAAGVVRGTPVFLLPGSPEGGDARADAPRPAGDRARRERARRAVTKSCPASSSGTWGRAGPPTSSRGRNAARSA